MTDNNKNFKVKNGLDIGPLSIDQYGDILTTEANGIDLYTNNFTENGVEVWLRHNDSVQINTANGVHSWVFDKNGVMTFPDNSTQTSAAVVGANLKALNTSTDVTLSQQVTSNITAERLLITDGATDSSTYADTLTFVGGAVTESQSDPWSNSNPVIYIDGYNGSYVKATYNSNLEIGTDDFTIDFWMYPFQLGNLSDDTYSGLVSTWGVGNLNTILNSDGLVYLFDANHNPMISSTTQPSINAWTHVAFTRSNNEFKLWINGVQEGSYSGSGSDVTNIIGDVIIGAQDTASKSFYGYLNDVRIVKGLALFTETFTPPNPSNGDYALHTIISTSTVLTNLTVGNFTATSITFPDNSTQTTAYTGTVNVFNQTLNTEDNVQFNRVDLTGGDGLATRFIGYQTNTTNETYFDLQSNALYINSDTIQFSEGSYRQHRAQIDSDGLKLLQGYLQFPDNSTQTTAATPYTGFSKWMVDVGSLAAADCGAAVQIYGTTTLPLATDCPEGGAFFFTNESGDIAYVTASGSDFIYHNPYLSTINTSITLEVGETLILASRGPETNEWDVVGGTAVLKYQSTTTVNSIKFPDGSIQTKAASIPVYTRATLPSTGSTGTIIVVSDSGSDTTSTYTAVDGMLAFWDTTNGRWDYLIGNNQITVPPTNYTAEVLLIGGGGAGGSNSVGGGGGGAGGVYYDTILLTPGTGYSIVIGSGGSSGGGSNAGGNGNNTTGLGFTALGGGGGGNKAYNGVGGGSGGGGGRDGYIYGPDLTSGGSGTMGQGNDGGQGYSNTLGQGSGAGGGGGAGAAGTDGFNGVSGTGFGGDGGIGTDAYSDWGLATETGDNRSGTVYYAGGGAGGHAGSYARDFNPGGFGGGGNGYQNDSGDKPFTSPLDGVTNTGGGGGCPGEGLTAGSGGSGLAIIRYVGSSAIGSGGSITVSGGYVYHVFTSSDTYTS